MVMMQSLHAHSTFDDGKSTPAEMAAAAAAAGLRGFGISAHSPMDGEPWTTAPERMAEFCAEMARLREVYAGKMAVWCGVEYDLASDPKWRRGFDYVIASVHTLETPSGLWALDDTRARARRMIVLAFHGDADAAAEAYYARVREIADIPEADVVGHFDLITKFDEPEPLYDARSPRYQKAALETMETLVRAGKIFEVNTGAVSRGYRTEFYPANDLLCALREMDGRVTITSDSHAADTVTFGYEMAEQVVRAAGFQALWQFDGKHFVPTEI